jgi:hypothetical protein
MAEDFSARGGAKYAETDTVIDLPDDLLREIGRVMVLFARLEWTLSRIAYALLGLDRTDGRIAVREPRATERIDMICQLLDYHKLPFSGSFQALRPQILEYQSLRDKIAHATWVRDPVYGALRIINTSGQWKPIPFEQEKLPRKVKPEGVTFELPEATQLSGNLLSVFHKLSELSNEIRQFSASQ